MKCLPVVHKTVLAALALLAGACGTSPPVRYYTLDAGPGSGKAAPAQPVTDAYVVAVGPVAVPADVERPQIVIQLAPNYVAIVDDHRWAEPLDAAIPRVIASDLNQLLAVPTVIFPRDSQAGVKYRVAIDIRNFVSVPGESATVDAAWTVYGPNDAIKRGQFVAREPVAQTGYEALAAAHGRALMSVSREVAATITTEEKSR